MALSLVVIVCLLFVLHICCINNGHTFIAEYFIQEKIKHNISANTSNILQHLIYDQYITWQIGFNKVGTTSFVQLFKANQVLSVHWKPSHQKSLLSMILFDQYIANKSLLSDDRISKFRFSVTLMFIFIHNVVGNKSNF